MTRILIADDEPTNLQLLVDALEPEGHEVFAVANGRRALELCERIRPDLILLDVMMDGLDGISVCRTLKTMPSMVDVPVVFITGVTDWERILDGFEAGGADYLVKPFRTKEVLVRIAHHLRLAQVTLTLAQRNAELERRMVELDAAHRSLLDETERRRDTERRLRTVDDELNALAGREAARWGIDGFIGRSDATAAVLADIRQLHRSANINVLINGESGTGKELVARAIHFGSGRAHRPFVAVNCVAIGAELAESIFFGHARGAFTGAASDHKGHFELANGGTLFLDEIGDMPIGLQPKLLRVLEDGIVRPVGGRRDIRTDVRIVAATNADLGAKIAAGRFREDLFYRLARYQITVPPLRERPQDIVLLARHFVERFAAEMGVLPPSLTATALEALEAHRFPGNVRELRNVIERALIRSSGRSIRPEHLGLAVDAGSEARPPVATSPGGDPPLDDGVPLNLKKAEAVLMQRALRKADGNVSEAARLLGVHRSRLYRAFD